MRLLLIGFGNVARTLAEMLSVEKNNFPRLNRLQAIPVGIATAAHGNVYNKNGLDWAELLQYFGAHSGFQGHSSFTKNTTLQLIEYADYDVLVELSALSVSEQGEPAVRHVRTALQRGKQVVTANKGPAAFAFRALRELAGAKGVRFLFESAVMDGAPVFNLARTALRGATITGIRGILNSTVNYILQEIEQGESLDTALEKAKQRGITETDPSYDLHGWDAAVKLCVLGNALLDKELHPGNIRREILDETVAAQARQALLRGMRLKQIAEIIPDGALITGKVFFSAVRPVDRFYSVSGSGSILQIGTDVMAPIIIQQSDPNLYDTAYGVLNDLLELRENRISRHLFYSEKLK